MSLLSICVLYHTLFILGLYWFLITLYFISDLHVAVVHLRFVPHDVHCGPVLVLNYLILHFRSACRCCASTFCTTRCSFWACIGMPAPREGKCENWTKNIWWRKPNWRRPDEEQKTSSAIFINKRQTLLCASVRPSIRPSVDFIHPCIDAPCKWPSCKL